MMVEITNDTVKTAIYTQEDLRKLKFKSDLVWPHAREKGDGQLYFSAQEKTSINVYILSPADSKFSYTYDGLEWTYITSSPYKLSFGGELGDVVLKNDYPPSSADYKWFNTHGITHFEQLSDIPFTVGGNMRKILLKDSGNGYRLFKNCTALVDASELILSNSEYVDSVKNWGGLYQEMFMGCTSLKYPPAFSGNVLWPLEKSCYKMFENCTSLLKTMNAESEGTSSTYLHKLCCSDMYRNCTSLENASNMKLYVLWFDEESCKGMFYNCTSLKKPPVIQGPTAKANAFESMFENCINLEQTCGSLGGMTSDSDNVACYMYKNCSKLTSAGTLPAFSGYSTFKEMFSGCPKLRTCTIPEINPLSANAFLDTFKDSYDLSTVNIGKLTKKYKVTWKEIVPNILFPRDDTWPKLTINIATATESRNDFLNCCEDPIYINYYNVVLT